MKKMKRYFPALLCFLLLLAWAFPAGAAEQSRLPGPAVMTEEEKATVLENGSVKRSTILDAALSCWRRATRSWCVMT